MTDRRVPRLGLNRGGDRHRRAIGRRGTSGCGEITEALAEEQITSYRWRECRFRLLVHRGKRSVSPCQCLTIFLRLDIFEERCARGKAT